MQVQIQIKGLPGSTRLRQFAAERLNAVLRRCADVIEEVTVRLTDINGPDRGGIDKLCRIVLRLKNDAVLVIEELSADIRSAIESAVRRIDRSVPAGAGIG